MGFCPSTAVSTNTVAMKLAGMMGLMIFLR